MIHRDLQHVWLAGALAACSFSGAGSAGDDDMPDATVDRDAPAFVCMPWDALNVAPCDPVLTAPIALALGVGSQVIDTATGVLTVDGIATPMPGGVIAQPDGVVVRIVNLTSLTIATGARLAFVGTHPVILVVHGDAVIDGTIDVSASLDTPGVGGNQPKQCVTASGGPGGDSTGLGGGGGGGGGAHAGDGAAGGDGQGAGKGDKGAKGDKTTATTLVPLRAGCGGGSGGDDSVAVLDDGGIAGAGGGAIEITTRDGMMISGTIAANGSSGGGVAQARAGGGGGGAGGAIVLDGGRVEIHASTALCANGGAGGEGGQLALVSSAGAPPTCTVSAALGGALIADGGDGGDGGAGDSNATPAANGTSEGGGGGGGGGLGRVRILGRLQAPTIDANAVISPPLP